MARPRAMSAVLAPGTARAARDHVAQRHVALALGLVADDVFLAEPFGADDDVVRHVRSDPRRSARCGGNRRCRARGTARRRQAEQEARQVERAFAAQDAPAEAVDHAHHRIEAVPEAPLLRHDGAGEADRRDIKAELHDERDDVAEVAVFHIERRDEQRRAEAREHGQHNEDRQEHDLPARRIADTKPSARRAWRG